jgi:hypothetical protein
LFKAANYSQRSRVFVENFAAKLPTSPQLTVLEYKVFKLTVPEY